MKKQPKVSVIVPIYNVEKYLRQCLDSIVGQTMRDIEIILVNDGSTDDSPAIIEEYAKKDPRIKVIDKANGEYGKACNDGIDAATGEYIGLVESDDWIEPDMYETLYKIAKTHDLDVVKCSFYFYDAKKREDTDICKLPEPDVEQFITPRRRPIIFMAWPSVWSAIYRRDFLNEKKIRFLESPGASYQDTAFNFKIWAMANTAYLTRRPLIHYRTGHESQSLKSTEKVFAVCDEFKEIERFMADYPDLFVRLIKIFNRVKWGACCWNYRRLEGNNREAFHQRMADEFTPIIKNKQIELFDFNWRDVIKMRLFLDPASVWLKTKYRLLGMGRWLVKTKCDNYVKSWHFLFGLIRLGQRPLICKGIIGFEVGNIEGTDYKII